MPPDIRLYSKTPNDVSPENLKQGESVSVYKEENGNVIIFKGIVTIVGNTYFLATNIQKTTYHTNGTEEIETMPTGYEELFNIFFGQPPFRWMKNIPDTPTKPPPVEKSHDVIGERLNFGGKRKTKRKSIKKKLNKSFVGYRKSKGHIKAPLIYT